MKKLGYCLLVVTIVATALSLKSNAEVADGYLVKWVQRREAKLSSQFEKRPFESIGWADEIRHALVLAEEHNRPIFLFTLDGHLGSGRC